MHMLKVALCWAALAVTSVSSAKVIPIQWTFNQASLPATITADVGDSLRFDWSGSFHDIALVTNEDGSAPDYPASCDRIFANTTRIAPGPQTVQLDTPGTFTWVCTVSNKLHCTQGKMHVKVTVVGSAAPTTSPPPTQAPATAPPPPKAATPGSALRALASPAAAAAAALAAALAVAAL